jgi:hypothetical protein
VIRALTKEVRIRLAARKLARLVRKQRAQFAAAHPEYDRRRKAALRHQPRSWA